MKLYCSFLFFSALILAVNFGSIEAARATPANQCADLFQKLHPHVLEYADVRWPDGEAVGPASVVTLGKSGAKVVIQEYKRDDGHHGMVVSSAHDGDVFAFLSFKPLRANQSALWLDLAYVRDDQRGNGLSEMLYRQVVLHYPHAGLLAGELALSNEVALLKLRRQGLTLDQAVMQTPYGKAMQRIGFGRIKIWLDDELEFQVEARRP